MTAIWDVWPWLLLMGLLAGISAFFSGSEAALFCLRWPDRAVLARGSVSQRAAERLLRNPDRLLSAVLFWNLLVNISYFAVASLVALSWRDDSDESATLVYLFTGVSLLVIIVVGELLPKSIAVTRPRLIAGLVGSILSLAVHVVDRIMPLLTAINAASRRVIWPDARNEPPLEIADIERAIELAQPNDALAAQEECVLRNLLELSELEVQELMRPSYMIKAVRPPVSIDDLVDAQLDTDVLCLTGTDHDEIEKAISLWEIHSLPPQRMDRLAQEVVYVPWCTTVADAFETMTRLDQSVCVVVNELGESLGVLTLQDVLDAVFAPSPDRGHRARRGAAILEMGPYKWQVNGMTSLRNLARKLEVDLPPTSNVTVGGVVMEVLERAPDVGDALQWGPLSLRVVRTGPPSHWLLEVERVDHESEDSS